MALIQSIDFSAKALKVFTILMQAGMVERSSRKLYYHTGFSWEQIVKVIPTREYFDLGSL